MLDDMINASFKCLKAIREIESQNYYPEMAKRRIEEAKAYLDILHKESPLMYRVLSSEYVKVYKQYYFEEPTIKGDADE